MNVVTVQMLCSAVAERWHKQYFNNGKWDFGESKHEIYEKLKALDYRTPENISNIIGNKSWTSLDCDSCKKQVDKVIVLDVTGGEYATHMCLDCLKLGVELLENTTNG